MTWVRGAALISTSHWMSSGCLFRRRNARQLVRRRTSIWHPADVRGILKPEPEPLAGGLRKLSHCSRSTDFLSTFSRVALWLSVAGGGKHVYVQATGNMKISVCAERRIHVSHPILLICCVVILAIPLAVSRSAPHTHTCFPLSNYDLRRICLCFPKSLYPKIKNIGWFWLPLPSFVWNNQIRNGKEMSY